MVESRALWKSVVMLGCVLGISLCVGSVCFADDPAERARAVVSGPAPEAVEGTVVIPPLGDLLFIGTSQNSTDPTSTLNDVFTVDPMTDTSASVATGVQVWGATADIANQRVLFTRSSGNGSGDQLFEVPYAGGDPASVGLIMDPTGAPMRIDGLAISGGVLYGTNADALNNGLYSIDWGTLVATQVGAFADSISGIDADPDTGVIYGVNDTTGQLVTLSPTGTITPVINYPAGFSDIDGIAVGNGIVYLVADEAGPIPAYDIAGAAYGTPLTSPFTSADVFSGAAYAVGVIPVELQSFYVE